MTVHSHEHPLDLSDAPGLRLVESEPENRPAPAQTTFVEIVVPALNEETRLGPSLARIAAYLAQQPYSGAITVVDNGSVDRTADLIVEDGDQHVPIRVMGCRDRGKGAAVRRGILTSTATYVGFSDADLSTPIETLDTIVPALAAGDPVVIASRRCPGAAYVVSQPLSRRLASRAFRRASRACMPRLSEIYDTQCGFKFFENGAAKRIFSASTAAGFAFDVEIIALAFLAGYEVTELPTRWEHVEGSQVSVRGDATRVLSELITMRDNLRSVARSGAFAGPRAPRMIGAEPAAERAAAERADAERADAERADAGLDHAGLDHAGLDHAGLEAAGAALAHADAVLVSGPEIAGAEIAA